MIYPLHLSSSATMISFPGIFNSISLSGKKGKEKGGKGDEAEAPPKTEEQKQAEEDPFGTLQAARQAKLDDEERMRKETEASEKQQADLLASARGMTSTMKGGKKGGKGGSNAMVKGRNLK